MGTNSRSPLDRPETPFELTDGVVALALYLSGAELADDDLWCTNTYTADGLRRLGFTGRMQQAAMAAVKASKAGIVRFLFKSKPARAVQFYNDEAQRLKEKDVEAVAEFDRLIDALVAGAMDKEEFKARSSCLILKTRIQFMNAWKQVVPFIQVNEEGKSRTYDTTARVTDANGGIRTVAAKGISFPGFKIIPANANLKLQKELGIKL